MRRKYSNVIDQRLSEQIGVVVKKNELISKHTTFKIGGPAKYFLVVENTNHLARAIKAAQSLKIKYFILGGGSNILVSDQGFDGLVIKNKSNNIKIVGIKGRVKSQKTTSEVFIEADSGVMFNRLVRFTLDQGLGGLENFLGQPGTVGGAVYINAHTVCLKQDLTVLRVEFVDSHVFAAKILSKKMTIKKVKPAYFKFNYDYSFLQDTKEILLSVIFALRQEDKDKLWQDADKIMAYRRRTQPYGLATSGCIFRNISQAMAMKIGTANHTRSAGFLIEAVGLKGKKIGGAAVDKTHANFFINTGNAKADDVYQLIKLVKTEVKNKFGVELKEEIVLLGKFD